MARSPWFLSFEGLCAKYKSEPLPFTFVPVYDDTPNAFALRGVFLFVSLDLCILPVEWEERRINMGRGLLYCRGHFAYRIMHSVISRNDLRALEMFLVLGKSCKNRVNPYIKVNVHAQNGMVATARMVLIRTAPALSKCASGSGSY